MNKLREIFDGLVDETMLKKITNHFDDVADAKLAELGVDSLVVMEIVVRIEDLYDIEIDYDEFEVELIETPRKIIEFIDKRK